jgi:glycosyltransferase involved in cell wall biosynthesis
MMQGAPPAKAGERIAVLLHDVAAGGAERVALKLVEGMIDAGHAVDLILVRATGEYMGDIPARARLIDLGKNHVFQSIPALARYLRNERPAALLSFLTHVNIAAILARLLSRQRLFLAISERNQLSVKAADARHLRDRLTYRLVPLLYPFADRIIAVSRGVARDVERFARLGGNKVSHIYNPIYGPALAAAAAMPVEHPWFAPGQPPVVLGAGRLHKQKGFDTLLRAFALARRERDIRLMIIGEGREREALEALARSLGVEDDVSLPGFVENPYALMSQASLFVLSSRWEGLPGVLIEALACGTTVISTDCPSGPSEILEDGRYGKLVPVDDAAALATAISEALANPQSAPAARAREFSIETATHSYLRALEQA